MDQNGLTSKSTRGLFYIRSEGWRLDLRVQVFSGRKTTLNTNCNELGTSALETLSLSLSLSEEVAKGPHRSILDYHHEACRLMLGVLTAARIDPCSPLISLTQAVKGPTA